MRKTVARGGPGFERTKPNSPAVGGKSEMLDPKSEMKRIRRGCFEKTKPISCFVLRTSYIVCRFLKNKANLRDASINVTAYLGDAYGDTALLGGEKTKPIKAN